MKISDLSKELGVTSKEIIAFANDKGIECKAATKNLSDEETEMVKKAFAKKSAPKEDKSAPKAAAKFVRASNAQQIVAGVHDGGKESFLVRFNQLAPEISITMVDKNRNIYTMDVRQKRRA